MKIADGISVGNPRTERVQRLQTSRRGSDHDDVAVSSGHLALHLIIQRVSGQSSSHNPDHDYSTARFSGVSGTFDGSRFLLGYGPQTPPRDRCARLRLAARDLIRNRTFTVAAILALTLGIGAGTAVFSVVDRILFRSLPYRRPISLVSFGMVAPIVPQEFLLGYDYYDWRDAPDAVRIHRRLEHAGVADCDLNDTRPQRLRCARVDSDLLADARDCAGRRARIHAGRMSVRDAPRDRAHLERAVAQSRWAGTPRGRQDDPRRRAAMSRWSVSCLPTSNCRRSSGRTSSCRRCSTTRSSTRAG